MGQNYPENQSSENSPDHKNVENKPEIPKATETKRLKRRLIVYEVLFFALLAVAGIVFFVNHTMAVVSVPLLFGGLFFAALFLRLSLISNGSKHCSANKWAVGIVVPSALLCGYLFWIEISPSENKPEPASVSLDLGPNVDPKDPMGQSFIILNGKQAISNIVAYYYWKDPTDPQTNKFMVLQSDAASFLLPGARQNLHLAFFSESDRKKVPTFSHQTFANIKIAYSSAFTNNEQQIFQFLVTDVAGTFVWSYDEEGPKLKDITEKYIQRR